LFNPVVCSWRALRVQKVDSERESSVSTEEVVPSTLPVSVSKTNWLDDDSDEDIDLEALSKALSEAGTLASHSKKKDGNRRSESVVKNSTLVARTGVDMETPGKVFFTGLVSTCHQKSA